MRILVLDDEPSIRETYRACFQKKGYLVHEESNGADGLLTLGQYVFHLVISDIHMPFVDGIRFLKIARPRFPQLPIVIISCDSPYNAKDVLAWGATGVLDKSEINCKKIQAIASKWTPS